MKLTSVFLASLVSVSGFASHNPLLPRPQQLQYGTGALPLRGLSIRFASPPSAEDRVTANQLAARPSEIPGTKPDIKSGKSSPGSILLNRTAKAGALPLDNETTGPDSREAYSLQVTSKGAEIRGRSSAGVFYGVQTLL